MNLIRLAGSILTGLIWVWVAVASIAFALGLCDDYPHSWGLMVAGAMFSFHSLVVTNFGGRAP